jgi:LCP family protein required for cell wall assembly
MTNISDPPQTSNSNNIKLLLLIITGIFILTTVLLYFLWFRPMITQPISAPLSLPTRVFLVENEQDPVDQTPESPSNLPVVPVFIQPTKPPLAEPVCGDDLEWVVLLVGIDSREDGYRYGLADIIRLVRIDFVEMTVNMIPLPRDLIVEVPDGRFTVQDPFKINQTYMYGTPGMPAYQGSGGGAGALAEAVQYNFGITVDHYVVINFKNFVAIIDAVGGVEVDLPGPVSDKILGDFPAGLQTLDGERALALARIRRGYGDSFRIHNQTLILKGLIKKMANPGMILKVPDLLNRFADGFLTDLSIEQMTGLEICTLRHFDTENLQAFDVPQELLTATHAYIPTLGGNSFVYQWGEDFVEWIHDSLIE